MNKLNNKGFSLIEVLAVIVILGVLATIMVPTIGSVFNKNKQDNYDSLKKSIISSARIYMSDNRYGVSLGGSCNADGSGSRNVIKVNGVNISNNKLLISTLVNEGNLTTNGDNKILNPLDKNESLVLNSSYVIVKYNCNTRDYDYELEDSYLIWQKSN